MVDFGGWDMPLHYGSQVEEHHQVRRDAGMFDVSHMTVVDLRGERVREFLRRLVANSVDKLQKPGKALYTCMLDEQGGIIDDLIVYFLGEGFFRLVVNAATRDKDLAWINRHAQAFDVEVRERDDFAMIAVQGPTARERVAGLLEDAGAEAAGRLARFSAAEVQAKDGTPLFLARTGYTGEDGFEIYCQPQQAVMLWDTLLAAGREHGLVPAGLACRDTLRLEAGMPAGATLKQLRLHEAQRLDLGEADLDAFRAKVDELASIPQLLLRPMLQLTTITGPPCWDSVAGALNSAISSFGV